MKIYIDSEFVCYVNDDGTREAIEAKDFDGKCPEYIEGHRYVPAGRVWTREDGEKFEGKMMCALVDYGLLEAAQAEYEHQEYERLLTENADMKAKLTAADMAYEEGVNSIYE